MARKRVHESGYQYAHGKRTRSKVFGGKGESTPSVVYSKEEARAKSLENIKDQIESNQTQLGFLEKGKEKAVASGQYGQAAAFEQQGVDLKIKLPKLKSEKRELQIKYKSLKKRRERRKSGLKQSKISTVTQNEVDVAIIDESEMDTKSTLEDNQEIPVEPRIESAVSLLQSVEERLAVEVSVADSSCGEEDNSYGEKDKDGYLSEETQWKLTRSALSESYIKKDDLYISALSGVKVSEWIDEKKRFCEKRHNVA